MNGIGSRAAEAAEAADAAGAAGAAEAAETAEAAEAAGAAGAAAAPLRQGRRPCRWSRCCRLQWQRRHGITNGPANAEWEQKPLTVEAAAAVEIFACTKKTIRSSPHVGRGPRLPPG